MRMMTVTVGHILNRALNFMVVLKLRERRETPRGSRIYSDIHPEEVVDGMERCRDEAVIVIRVSARWNLRKKSEAEEMK